MDEWISEAAAIEWLKCTYGMPDTAAMAALRDAFETGLVDAYEEISVTEVGGGVYGARLTPLAISCVITDRVVHDLRFKFDDVRWQIERQLGAPSESPQLRPKVAPSGGGRPATVAATVERWFANLDPKHKARSATKLAKSYCAETPKPVGSEDHVRKIISQLKGA